MGVITLPANVETDRQNGIKASSVHVQGNFDALLTAVNRKLEIDGSIVPTADIPMGNHKITGVAAPTLTGDATNKGYVDNADTSLSNTISTLDNAVVKLAGAQTITGQKNFTADTVCLGALIKKSPTDDYTVAPGSSIGTSLALYDKNNQLIGGFEHYHQSDGSTISRMSTRQQNANDYSVIDVGFTAGGYRYTSAPACDLANSIVTTINTQKLQNGYFKLGNGLIIQWMRGKTTTQNAYITLPTAFSSAYSYAAIITRNAPGEDVYPGVIYEQGSSYVRIVRVSGMGSGLSYNIVAIGY